MPSHTVGERRPATTGKMPDFNDKVRRFISEHKGAAQAVTINQISGWIWEDEWKTGSERVRKNMARAVKGAVQALRNKPHCLPIAAARGARLGDSQKYDGYFLAETAAEIEQSIKSMRSQAISMLATCAAMKKTDITLIERDGGQGRMFFERDAYHFAGDDGETLLG